MTSVVLGWDGLDYELVKKFDLAGLFGPYCAKLETFNNPTLATPHTRELWPSIISGVRPEEHGIWAATDDGGLNWSNPLLNQASSLANGIVPKEVREQIGLWLRDAGANVDQHGSEYYQKQGVGTIFQGRESLPLAIPNFTHPLNNQLDLVTDRGADLADFLHIVQENGKTIHKPKVPIHIYQARLAAEATEKLGIVRTAVELDYDIVFVWLGYIDSVGHIAPVVDQDNDWQARAYRHVAEWTDSLRSVLPPGDTLVTVSDHGLRNGEHTHQAVIASTNESVVVNTNSVLDVRDALDSVTPSSGTGSNRIRPAFLPEVSTNTADRDGKAVREQLENLGYF